IKHDVSYSTSENYYEVMIVSALNIYYMIASQGGRYTKHIYIGSQRIVSIRWFKWSYLDRFF
ncbi:hypothetical protein HMPREF1869_00954, partial [Bacteroidales bacterium KA00251]